MWTKPLLAGALLAAGWLLTPMADCQVVISELMASAVHVRPDRRSGAHDWVELHNLAEQSVSLAGWFLTDDVEKRPTRWRFPASARIPGRGFLVVHCTGHACEEPLHTNFALSRKRGAVALISPDGVTIAHRVDYGKQHSDISFGFAQESAEQELLAEGAQGRVLVPTGATPGWTAVDFDDSSWRPGESGFGFDFKPDHPYAELIRTEIADILRHRGTSVLLRFPFEIEAADGIDLVRLEMRYEEGFVAHLGGVEIHRENVAADADWSSEAIHRRAVEDAMRPDSFAIGGVGEEELLHAGRNVLAIQGFLIGKATRDCLVLPRLIGIRVGALDMAAPLYLTAPTPGAPNVGGAPSVTKRPRLRVATGEEPGTRSIALECRDAAASIHYTLDGTLPTSASTVATGPVRLEGGRRLAAIAIAPGSLPSAPVFEQFPLVGASLREWSSDLPLVIVETFGAPIEPAGAARSQLSIFDVGADGDDGHSSPAREPTFSGLAGIRTRGSSTLHRPKKAYALELWTRREKDRDAALLGMPEDSDWILYGAYNFDKSLIRNTLMYELSNLVGRYAPRTRFIELFINETGGPTTAEHYVGVYALIEKIKRGRHRLDLGKKSDGPGPGYILKVDRPDPGDYGFAAGGEDDLRHVDPREREIEPADAAWIHGYLDDFAAALSGDGAHPGDYSRFIDVDSFVDFHLLNELSKNPDAYTLSTYMHLPRGGKLTMGPIWDFDRALRTNDDAAWVGKKANPRGWSDAYRHGWWGDLLEDQAFRSRYRKRWFELRSGPLSLARVLGVIDGQVDELREAQARNFRRWPLLEDEPWEEVKIQELKEWISDRIAWMDHELFPLTTVSPAPGGATFPAEVRLGKSDSSYPGDVFFTIDGTDPRGEGGQPTEVAQLFTGPFTIPTDTKVTARIRLGLGLWGRPLEAYFTRQSYTLTVTEIMYEPPTGSEHEFLELYNHGDLPLDLEGVHFLHGVGFDFSGLTMAPGEYAVIVRDEEAFREHFGDEGIRILGQFERKLDDHDVLHLLGGLGQTIFRLEYSDTWYPETDGEGPSLVLRDLDTPVEEWSRKESWRPGETVGGTPGR